MSVYLGIDWSEHQHDVCFMNSAGAVVQFLTVAHSVDGFAQLDQAIQALGQPREAVYLGLETAHTLLIDFMLERGYPHLYVLPPSQVKANQDRFAQSHAKDDQRDGWVLADMLRTDRGRYRPWRPDTRLTRQIQVQVRYVLYLTRMIRRQTNHLRALLLRYYPLAAGFALDPSNPGAGALCALSDPHDPPPKQPSACPALALLPRGDRAV